LAWTGLTPEKRTKQGQYCIVEIGGIKTMSKKYSDEFKMMVVQGYTIALQLSDRDFKADRTGVKFATDPFLA
jgi:hypothetical protein